MSEALNALMRREMTVEDYEHIRDELNAGPDRSAALLGGTLCEIVLYGYLRSRMVALTSRETKDLFGASGPLSSFSSHIRLSHALGMIGPRTKTYLERVKAIRNVFAHSPAPVEFSTAAVKAACANLDFVPVSIDDPRERFVGAVQAIVVYLWSKSPGSALTGANVYGLD